MAGKRIVISGDAGPLRAEFERTAKDIDQNLEKLGAKTQSLNLTGKQRAESLRQDVRGVDPANVRKQATARLGELDRQSTAANAERKSEDNLIRNSKDMTAAQKEKALEANNRISNGKLAGINEEQEQVGQKLAGAEGLESSMALLGTQMRGIDNQQRSRHNEWSTLTRKELDAMAKEVDGKLATATNPDDIASLRADRMRIGQLQRDKPDEDKKKDDPIETLRKMAMFHYASQAINTVGNAVGNTTGAMTGIATNAISAGGANFNFAEGAAIAGAVATIGTMGLMLQKGKELETARNTFGEVSSIADNRNFGRTPEALELGFDQTEFMNQANTVARARGSSQGIDNNTLNQIRMRKGLGLDDGALAGMNSMSKVGVDDTRGAVMRLLSVLEGSALVNLTADKFDVSSLPHYLERLTQMNQRSLEVTGKANNGRNTDILATVMGMGGIFKDYRTAGTTADSIGENFRSKDTIKRYFNSQAVLKAHPELRGKYADIEMQMENPDARTQAAMINSTIARGKAIGGTQGDKEMTRYTVMAMLADSGFGTFSKASQAMGGMRAVSSGEANLDLNGRAKLNTGLFDVTDAKMTNMVNQPGEGLINAIDKAIKAMAGGATLLDVANAVRAISTGGDRRLEGTKVQQKAVIMPEIPGARRQKGMTSRQIIADNYGAKQ